MKKIQLAPRLLVVLLVMCVSTGRVFSQDSVNLSIGDPAPPIKYSRWLKGTPAATYTIDKIHVIEFWATWCGPCIAAMPHLSELAKKYEDKAIFIGANVWEKTGDKPYESSLPAVERFVNSSANRMSYHVIADNNAQDLVNQWLTPAGIAGIPSTFVVKNGKIVWIGHPMKLDSILDPIIAGTFDIVAFKKKYENDSKINRKLGNDIKNALKAVNDAVAAKDFERAFLMIDEGIKNVPIMTLSLKLEKFRILLNHFPEEKALIYARDLIKDNKSFSSMIAQQIIDKDGLSKASYIYAADILTAAVESNKFSLIYNMLALAYSKAGEWEAAVNAQELAVAAAKKEVSDPKFEGRVFDYTITDYEETLKKYKKFLK